MEILRTERLILRELEAERDADFVLQLLNSPKFLKYIGDRGVRNSDAAAAFIRDRYRKSYQDHGYGLYAAETKADGVTVGMCGFVRRDTLSAPDIGFAFLPEYEGLGYGSESAFAAITFGRTTLGFRDILAITTEDNHASGKLLGKLGFKDAGRYVSPEGQDLRLFRSEI